MKKIKRLLALAAMACALTSAFAESADIVVLMDASGTILPWFDQINNRILVDITRKFVREGDTFHLVSFNSRVNLEIVQPIESEADISRVVSRFMLLYPLGQNSDFLSGLQYTWQYVSSLDHLRDKIIIVISDGIFNPPRNSPYAEFSPEQVKSELSAISRKIRSAGWNVYYIKLPFPEQAEIRTLDGNLVASPVVAPDNAEPGSGGAVAAQGSTTKSARKGKDAAPLTAEETAAPAAGQKTPDGATRYYDVSSDFTDSLDIPQSPLPESDVPITFIDSVFSMPEIEFPEDIGRKGRAFILPFKVNNISDNPVNMELTGIYLDGTDILGKNSFLNLGPKSKGTLRAEVHLPATVKKGPTDLPLSLEFSGNLRVHPQSGTVHLTVMNFSPEIFFRAGGPVVFALILICIAVLLVLALFIFIFRRTSSPAADAVRSAGDRESAARNAAASPAQTRPASAASFQKPAAMQAFPSRKTERKAAQAKNAIPSVSSESAATLSAAAASAAPASEAASILGRATAFGKKFVSGISGASASAASSAEILESARGNNASEAAQILADARKAEPAPREISWTPEKRELPVAAAPSFDPDTKRSVEALATRMAAEKDERAAILDAAARKYKPEAHIRSGASASEHIAVRGNTNTMLELYVKNQNPNIGKRNIHMMKAGTRLGLGGGSSAFLIFLVRFPSNVAEIRYDGQNCSLAILKPQYFPYENANIIENCIGREITLISDKQYEVTFEIRVYEDPVLKLNRILTSITY